MREPSFYEGLCGPLLCSALRRGITYPWGLRLNSGPSVQWMLSSDSDSTLGTAPSRWGSFPVVDNYSPETGYLVFFMIFFGSYSSCFFSTARVIAAIWRAMVSFARLGLVLPSTNAL